MRRWISVLLVLFFGLWPLSGALEASDDSRLPACCRRHGAHHCAMTGLKAQAGSGVAPMLSAPTTCPLFPGFLAGPSAPGHALAASVAGWPVVQVQMRGLGDGPAEARMRPAGIDAGRGPPALALS